MSFDYYSTAELFPARSHKSGQGVSYRRFSRAADAIKFAIEEMPSNLLLGTYLEVGEARFDRQGIRKLYDDDAYPLPRRRTK